MHRNLYKSFAKAFILSVFLIECQVGFAQQNNTSSDVFNFVFVSDSHFGLVKSTFREKTDVPSSEVNMAVVEAINQLPSKTFPLDGGINAGLPIANIEFVAHGGDIANRAEKGVQTAEVSWKQFLDDFGRLTVKSSNGQKSKLYFIPGNHDVSNAIGHTKIDAAKLNPIVMSEMYRLMVDSTTSTPPYHYSTQRIHYSFTMHDIHFQFLNIWPDSAERQWMASDLKQLQHSNTPVIIITHDEPKVEVKHFTGPDAAHADGFENLLEPYQGDSQASNSDFMQIPFSKFIASNPAIKAYFHGNSNWTEFYTYKGPDNNISLPVFRVDSPMKGEHSKKDESKLSFLIASINPKTKKMTVRECFYNVKSKDGKYGIDFGVHQTIDL